MPMVFTIFLLGLAVLIYPLRRNRFYLLNAAMVIGASYYVENHWFRVENIFSYKIILLFLVFHIVCINLTTFIAYGVDKRAAVRRAWRVPENDLHALEFLGGWIGAGFGQRFSVIKRPKKASKTCFT